VTLAPPHLPIRFELDIPYAASAAEQQQLDLIRPVDNANTSLPLVIFLHGGAWQEGDKADGRPDIGKLVRTLPCVVAAVNYRFTSQAPWPAQLHDCKAAIRWLRAHATQYGIDPARVAVWGIGAGAHLALMLATTGDNRGFSGSVGHYHNQSTKIQAVINYAGVVDLAALTRQPGNTDYPRLQSAETKLLGAAPQDIVHTAAAASPLHLLHAGTPPILSFHSQQDEIIPADQAEQLHERLTELGVSNQLIRLAEGKHGQFPDETLDQVMTFLQENFSPSA